jgi:hypothetical protein
MATNDDFPAGGVNRAAADHGECADQIVAFNRGSIITNMFRGLCISSALFPQAKL